MSKRYVVLCDVSNYPSIVIFNDYKEAFVFESLLLTGYQLWGTKFEPVNGKTCILPLPDSVDIDGCNWVAECLEQCIKDGNLEGISVYGE